MITSKGWQPLKPLTGLRRLSEDDIVVAMERTGADRADAIAALDAEEEAEYWLNDLYQVALIRHEQWPNVVQLNIRRRDGRVILRDWRHFQWIKNQLVGEENEGIEIYPAESRLTDTGNKYHLWVFIDPAYRIPFGFAEREVVTDAGPKGRAGYRQRPL
jgi:hypothetical protein